MLAGISPNYYLRLEQGRDRHPSAQVLDALARALQLDAAATAFLHSLARPEPATHERPQRERAPASIEWLIGSWHNTPALVHDRRMDILAANRLSLALTPALCPGANGVRAIFMEPAHADDLRRRRLGGGRHGRRRKAPRADRPRRGRSSSLRTRPLPLREQRGLPPTRWARQDIKVTSAQFAGPTTTRSWDAWRCSLRCSTIVGTDRQALYIRHAEPGSPSEHALHRLADMAAGAGGDPDPASGRDSGALVNAG